jgi:hypothetical protein
MAIQALIFVLGVWLFQQMSFIPSSFWLLAFIPLIFSLYRFISFRQPLFYFFSAYVGLCLGGLIWQLEAC